MIDQEKRNFIYDAAEKLGGELLDIVYQLVKSLRRAISSQLHSNDYFFTQEAVSLFGAHILKHHAGSHRPLKKEHFEYVMADVFEKLGHRVSDPKKQNFRGYDLQIDNLKLSLKTQGAQNLKSRSKYITISKLMEARWIRDMGGVDPRVPVREHLVSHFRQYDIILMLRVYIDAAGNTVYDLHDIPIQLLLRVCEPKNTFVERKGQTTSIWVGGPESKTFRLKLDGSVEKLTIDNLSPANCPLIASWTLAPI